MSAEFRSTILPTDAPDYLIGSPSRNRWLAAGEAGGKPKFVLPDTLNSVQEALSSQDLSNDTWLIVSDASRPETLDQTYEQASSAIHLPENPARTFVLTRKTRRKIAEQIMEKTGLSYEVVKASVDGAGYGDNRDTLDNAIAALSQATDMPIRFAMIDDDVSLTPEAYVWRKDVLNNQGIEQLPNSQVVFAFNGHNKLDYLTTSSHNNIRAFFDPLGKTVAQLREEHPDMKVSENAVDTRADAFLQAQKGEMAQFVLSADSENIPNADKAVVIGTTEDKSGLPDYPTWIISLAMLQGEYPKEEPVEAYPSGPKELYAAQGSKTIFPDSALFGRVFDASSSLDPAYWPWWHVSSLSISKETGMAESSLRSDNDFLPKWLKHIHEKTGRLYLYASGIPAYAKHTRTPFGGDRRQPTESAIASQVGNIAAVETFKRFEFSPQGEVYMHPIEEGYQAPEEHAQVVYDRMSQLAEVSRTKIQEIDRRLEKVTDPIGIAKNTDLIERYCQDLRNLNAKMADFNYVEWKKRLDTAIRRQLNFSRQHALAKPIIIHELSQLIKQGKYPVVEIVRT